MEADILLGSLEPRPGMPQAKQKSGWKHIHTH